jgi:hypothetical protein
MVREGMDSTGIDASRPDPRPSIPTQLQASVRLWLLAVAAGLFETALAVVDATSGNSGSAAEVAVGVAVRLLAFTGLAYLATRLRQGKNWARVALAVLYGGLGTLSLVIGPVTWLAEGGSLADAVAAADLGSVLFAASRVVHLGAVIAALVLMFTPAANAYIRATRRTRAERNHVRSERHPPPTALPSATRDPGRPRRRAR